MFEHIKQHRMTARLVRGLAVLLFVQMLIPLQAHARITQDASGLTVVVCTLAGTRNVQIGLDGDVTDHPHASAAMTFSDLLNNISPLVIVVQPPVQVLSWSLVPAPDSVPLTYREQRSPCNRGPPLA